jgi:hypothetical protein
MYCKRSSSLSISSSSTALRLEPCEVSRGDSTWIIAGHTAFGFNWLEVRSVGFFRRVLIEVIANGRLIVLSRGIVDLAWVGWYFLLRGNVLGY